MALIPSIGDNRGPLSITSAGMGFEASCESESVVAGRQRGTSSSISYIRTKPQFPLHPAYQNTPMNTSIYEFVYLFQLL